MKCVAWKALVRGSMLGFADLEMASGLILRGCVLLAANGKRWCNPPGRPTLDADRKPQLDDAGKIVYAAVIDFSSRVVRSAWSAEAVAAIDAHLKSTTPAEASVESGRNSSGGQPQESW